MVAEIVEFTTDIQGKSCVLQIKKDLTWGEAKEFLSKATIHLPNGQQSLDFTKAADILLTKVIVGGLPFKPTPVAFAALSMTEISCIIGELFRILPLETWLKNLGDGLGLVQGKT